MTETAAVPGLTEAESRQLAKLHAKANAAGVHAPAVQVGEPYVALTNLSLPRRGDKDKMCDLIPAGETVYLTPEEAASFQRHGDRDGRQVAVIRKKSEVDGNNPPRPHPMLLSGRVNRPMMPPPGSSEARPDPEGSSKIVTYGQPVPEMSQQGPAGTEGDAMDIKPGGGGPAASLANVDLDLVSATKAQMGLKG